MRYSMIRLRNPETVKPFERAPEGLADLVRALHEAKLEVGRYEGSLADVAFELVVEESFVAQIATRFEDGVPPSAGSRMLLEDTPLDRDHWRLSDGTIIDLSAQRELLAKARLVEKLRTACRQRVAG